MLLHQKPGCQKHTKKCARGTNGEAKPPVGGLKEGFNNPCCLDAIKDICWYISDLFDNNGIKYWMDFGTLLGAVRENGILMWDKDADLGVLKKDESKIQGLFKKIKKDGYDIDKPWDGIYKVYYSPQNRNYIDLFTWDKWPMQQSKKEQWKRACMHNALHLNHKKFFPSYFIEETVLVNFNGKQMRAPRDTEKFLELRFGRDWRIPQRKWDDQNRISWPEIQKWCEDRGWRA